MWLLDPNHIPSKYPQTVFVVKDRLMEFLDLKDSNERKDVKAESLNERMKQFAEAVVAWSEGQEIEYRNTELYTQWSDFNRCPEWKLGIEYRIKPEPDIIVEERRLLVGSSTAHFSGPANVRFVFDGETKELKSVEMIK